ncbi:MAG: integrase core domain-containing protein [Candidatus Poribacteria bacterium]|nr:integrase core domain-containing protein [Candidatus Poribacteria bacterium]
MTAKVELVETHRETYGLNGCLDAVGLSKSVWYAHQRREPSAKEFRLRREIARVIEAHPGYGYRRITPEVSERLGEPVNHKRVRRVLSRYEIGLPRCLPAAMPSRVQTLIREVGSDADLVKGKMLSALNAFSTDFTELVYAEGRKKGWAMVLLDIKSRWAGGWTVAAQRHRQTALSALTHLRSRMEVYHRDLEGVIIHHDRDSVYTSHDWLRQVLLEDHARLSYAQHGAKDNPWIEAFWGRMKTEIGEAVYHAATLDKVREIVHAHLNYYNQLRRHSSLDYRPPEWYLGRIMEGTPSQTLAEISP